MATFKEITLDELVTLESKLIIDVREPHEFITGTLKGAKNIPMVKLIGKHKEYLSVNETYYMLCRTGRRSAEVCKSLSKLGYKVVNIKGGILEAFQKHKSEINKA